MSSKKAPAKKAEVKIAVSPVPTAPKPKIPLTPAPPSPTVLIPIKPIPQMSVPSRIVIEPAPLPPGETDDIWKPKLRTANLKEPPKILLERKKTQKPEIEDILEEPAEIQHEAKRSELRPVVRTGLYRKIAIGFGVLALLLGALVVYVLYARATVTVFPQKFAIVTQQEMTIAADPHDGDVPGQIAEVTVSGERVAVAGSSTSVDAVSSGKVVLINETGSDILLIRMTRLLSPDGVLFRLKNRVSVPAHGRVTTDMYADKAGAPSDIGPTTFSIPGLSADLQKKIYAISDTAAGGGTVSTGVVTSAEVDKTEADLHDALAQQAKDELVKKIDAKWTGTAFVVETMSRFVSSSATETAESVTVRLTIRVRGTGFDQEKALSLASGDLKQKLTADRELLDTDAAHAVFTLTSVDPETNTASLHLQLNGRSQVALSGPSFNPAKLKGKSLDEVHAYFQGIEGVENIGVTFVPAWIERMPEMPDHITIQINK